MSDAGTRTGLSAGGASPGVSWEARADLVVVGGGVAGLSAALAGARRGLAVLVLQKGPGPGAAPDTSTAYAQGGIAVARRGADTPSAHADDTCAAGGGLCDRGVVESIVADGESALFRLVAAGARFDRTPAGPYAVTREGGHRTRRILHAGGDATGAEVQRALDAACRVVPCVDAPRITRMRGVAVLRVCTDPADGAAGGTRRVAGVLVARPAARGGGRGVDGDCEYGVVHSPNVLLATGGVGGLYVSSTNPLEATADGIALGLDAGAVVGDLEFIQFHPTALHTGIGAGRSPLVSEAVRGEGAVLVDGRGRSITAGVHPMGDLAPRDVVARAIAMRLREAGGDHVLLDARGIDAFAARFPTITASCSRIGIDPASDPIPVAPAAHFSCGGIVTDARGRTGVPGLFAAGEVARTGLHGANRLASNSLLEGLVVGERVGAAAADRVRAAESSGVGAEVPDVDFRCAPVAPRARLRSLMTTHASVVRSGDGLAQAAAELASGMDSSAPVRTRRTAEDAAMTMAARAVLLAAAARTETRGCHTRADHPDEDPARAAAIRIAAGPDGAPRIVARNGSAPAEHMREAGVPA